MQSFTNQTTTAAPTRNNGVVGRLYERITGKPYITVGGHASRDFGPTPGAEIAAVFDVSAMSDAELIANADQLLADARRITAELRQTEVRQ